MLTEPDITDETIVTCAAESFGLRTSNATFLPIGADVCGEMLIFQGNQ